MALCLGAIKKALRFAAIATVASVVGGVGGYLIGWGAWEALGDFFFNYVPGVTPEAFQRIQELYDRFDFAAVFIAGLTPIPYKVFTLSAGIFSIISVNTIPGATALTLMLNFPSSLASDLVIAISPPLDAA